jgi:hypothetical protein
MGDNNLPANSAGVPAGFYRKEDVVDALISNFPFYPRHDHTYCGIDVFNWLEKVLAELPLADVAQLKRESFVAGIAVGRNKGMDEQRSRDYNSRHGHDMGQ